MSIGTKSGASTDPGASARLSIAWRDAELPPDIIAPGQPPAEVREILVTGGTGFFGRHLLEELVTSTDAHLHVLVRADSDVAARARLLQSLAPIGLVLDELKDRITVHRGDSAEERFGLADLAYERLAERIDLVFHGAAEVNWARGYPSLRETNVGGTLQAIRFAARRRTKRMAFISTIAAGFMDGGPGHVNESTPTLPYLDLMPLGYAQTKCVSEELLSQAADRGIPAVVTRASLLIGDTRSGQAADADLTTALIEGCVRKARALDIDWLFECLPVDYAARASLALALAGQGGFERYHLRARNPRHWREIALWLNLMGYGVELEPVPDWLERQFGSRSAKVARLFPFRRFFIGLPGTPPPLRPFEIFLRAQRKVDCSFSEGRLASLGINEPTLDLTYFERCMEDLRRRDVLPAVPGGVLQSRSRECSPEASRACGGRGIATIERLPFDASAGFLNEIAAARYGTALGIRRERWTTLTGDGGRTETHDVLVKARGSNDDMHRLLVDVAGFCNEALGEAVRRLPHLLRSSQAGITEAELHAVLPARVRALMPAFHGSWSEHGGTVQCHAEAFVPGRAWTAADGPWSDSRLERITRALALVHAIPAGDKAAVRMTFPRQLGVAEAIEASSFWRELAGFTAGVFDGPGHGELAALLDEALGTLGSWWPELERHPKTLVHNDANPRNVIWVEEPDGEQPILVDWELASFGPPQADMAELGCFVLPDEAGPPDFARWMEDHRLHLERASCREWDRETWHRGARHALLRFGLRRLPLYAMAHRIRPQVWMLQAARRWATFASAPWPG